MTRPYELRHTAATLMGAGQAPTGVISERLGHSDVSLTLRTCRHAFPTLQASAADAIDRLLLTGSSAL
jgi:integrase